MQLISHNLSRLQYHSLNYIKSKKLKIIAVKLIIGFILLLPISEQKCFQETRIYVIKRNAVSTLFTWHNFNEELTLMVFIINISQYLDKKNKQIQLQVMLQCVFQVLCNMSIVLGWGAAGGRGEGRRLGSPQKIKIWPELSSLAFYDIQRHPKW